MKKITINNFIDYVSQAVDLTGEDDQYRSQCPVCLAVDNYSKKSVSISAPKGVFQCFRCGVKGKWTYLITLLQKHGMLSLNDVGLIVTDSKNTVEKKKEISSLYEFERTFRKIDNSFVANIYRVYLNSRGITNEDIEFYNIMYSFEGFLKGRIILPVYEKGKLVFFTARTVDDKHPIKYINPKGVNKNEILGMYDHAKYFSHIYLCEGFFDAMALGTNAMCMFGKTLHSRQLYKLMKLDVKHVTIALDADAKKEATKIGQTLQNYFKVDIKYLEEGDPFDNREQIHKFDNTKFSYSLFAGYCKK